MCVHSKLLLILVVRWLKRVPLIKSSDEGAWLFHEIGRGYWEKGDHQSAKDYGAKSLTAAQDASDHSWQLNASMLIAQAEGLCVCH